MTELLTKIGPFIDFKKGKAPANTYEKFEYGLKPYLSPEYLRGMDNPLFVKPNGKLIQVDEGEIIVLWDGSNAGEIFVSRAGILASTMTKLIVDENEFDRRYFNYSMKYLEYILKAKTAGSGIPHVDKGIIKNLELFKPPKPEQQKIAAILTKVDDAIQAVKNTIEKAERLKKSLMQNLLTGKLKPDGTWRRDDEFYEDEKFGKVPVGWNCGQLGNIAEVIAGQSPTGDSYNSDGKGIPMLNGPTEFTDRYPVVVQYTTKPTKICNKGDILFTVRGSSTGRMNIADKEYCIGRGLAAIREIKDISDNGFIYFTLITIAKRILAEAKGAGSTFPNVNRGELLKKKIIYPKADEQFEIAKKIKSIENVIIQKETKIQKLERLKKALMQNLLTGKVRVKV